MSPEEAVNNEQTSLVLREDSDQIREAFGVRKSSSAVSRDNFCVHSLFLSEAINIKIGSHI